jgi:hypothetical protein
VWAPALVGWHGMPGVRDPSPAGSVRWYPLAPRDVYVPVHHASTRYVRAVNVANTSIINNTQITNAWRGRVRDPRHANRDIPGAMTSLPSSAFASDPLRHGRVLRANPTESAGSTPHLAITQPRGRDNAWREAFNARPADPRRSAPSLPNDRRVMQSTPSAAVAPVDPAKFRRREQPPKNLSEVRPATPSDSWQARGQRNSPQVTRSAGSDSGRGDRGGAFRSGGRTDNSASRGGESRMSGSRASSGGGTAHAGRGGGESRMSGSSGSRSGSSSSSRSGRGGGLSARP